VPLGFGLDVRRRTFPACRDLADGMGDSFAFDAPACISTFPIADVPAISNADDLSLLFFVSAYPTFPLFSCVHGLQLQTGPFGSQLHESDYMDGGNHPFDQYGAYWGAASHQMIGPLLDHETAARLAVTGYRRTI
jgi:hypothetical protein